MKIASLLCCDADSLMMMTRFFFPLKMKHPPIVAFDYADDEDVFPVGVFYFS